MTVRNVVFKRTEGSGVQLSEVRIHHDWLNFNASEKAVRRLELEKPYHMKWYLNGPSGSTLKLVCTYKNEAGVKKTKTLIDSKVPSNADRASEAGMIILD